MTRRAFDAQAQLVERLRGWRCSQVSLGEDDELILDFGLLSQSSPGELDGELWLIIECPWRLDDPDEVVCGWDDDDDHITDGVRELVGADVEALDVRRPGFDLAVTFTTGHRLRVFPDLVAYYTDDTTSLAIPWYVGGDALTAIPQP